jgi:hypothetical protein
MNRCHPSRRLDENLAALGIGWESYPKVSTDIETDVLGKPTIQTSGMLACH